MSWKIAREVAELFEQDNVVEIQKILDPCSLEQRKCITTIKIDFSPLLFIAVENGGVSIVNYFLKKCEADPNATGYICGQKLTCLAAATRKGYKAIVSILLRHGADIEAVSFGQQTALFYAIIYKRPEIAKLLIEHGANVNCCNILGDSILMRSMFDLDLFKYLIYMGANVNIMNELGRTPLMLALQTGENEIIFCLLSCANVIIRLKNCFEEDAFHLVVSDSSPENIERILKKGNYTKNEAIKVCQVESCVLHTMNMREKSKDLWKVALMLQSLPSETPMFRNPHPAGKLQEIADDFNADDVPALLYLESMNGLSNIFTLTAYIAAATNVTHGAQYIRLGEYFLKVLQSLDDNHFFPAYRKMDVFIFHYFWEDFQMKTSEILKLFELFVAYIEDVRARLERMSPQERTSHAHKVEWLLYNTIDLLVEIQQNCPNEMHLFHRGTKRILKADLRNSHQETLMQLCVRMCHTFPIVKLFLNCGANVNSTDKEGKTVLHEVVEYPMNIKDDIVKIIITDKRFNFNEIKYDKYCLPCMLEKQYLLPTPAKHISLQCLAARAFCEKTLTSFSDVPHHLMAMVNSHLYIPYINRHLISVD